MARTFEFVLQFVGCVTVTVSPNQIIIIIIIIIVVIVLRIVGPPYNFLDICPNRMLRESWSTIPSSSSSTYTASTYLCQTSRFNSTGWTPSNIPPSTAVLCYSLFYAHSLHAPLHTTPHFPWHISACHSGHIHPCAFLHPVILFLPLNMPKPSQPCSLDLVLDAFNAQMTRELIATLPIR